MFLVFLIKNMCLLAFYFAFTTIIFIQDKHPSMVLVYFMSLACLSVSYMLNKRNERGKLKYIPAFAMLIMAIYLRSITGTIIVVFLSAYIFFVAKTNEYSVEYHSFKDIFFKMIMGSFILMVLSLIIGRFDIFKELSLLYIATSIVSGIYLLRTARHSDEVISSKQFAIMNTCVIFAVCLICGIFSSRTVLNLIFAGINAVYSNVIVPIILGIAYVTAKVLGAVIGFILSFVEFKHKDEVLQSMAEALGKKSQEIAESANTVTPDAVSPIFGYIIAIIVMVLLLVWIFNKKREKINGEADGISQERSFLDNDESDKHSRKINNKKLNNNNKIRQLYKKFLVLCHRRKIDIRGYDNTQSIYDKSNEVFLNRENELNMVKEIYRKARYSKESSTSDDIKAIKNIYKELESEKADFKVDEYVQK